MQRIVMAALLAGALAGVVAFVLHAWQTTPLIVHAEAYENAAPGAGQAAASAAAVWPAGGFERNAYSLLVQVVTAIGFAFVLVGAMALSGRDVDWRRGIVWGLCGYAAFFAAPALGLAPKLPGMGIAELGARQTWWLATAAVSAVALGLIFLTRGAVWKALAAALLLAPHAVGAPQPLIETGGVPAELAARFAVASMIVSGLFWMALGGFGGYFYRRFET